VGFVSASVSHEEDTGIVFHYRDCICNFSSLLGFNAIKMKLNAWLNPAEGVCWTESPEASQNRGLNKVECFTIPVVFRYYLLHGVILVYLVGIIFWTLKSSSGISIFTLMIILFTHVSSLIDYKSQEGRNIVYFFLFRPHH